MNQYYQMGEDLGNELLILARKAASDSKRLEEAVDLYSDIIKGNFPAYIKEAARLYLIDFCEDKRFEESSPIRKKLTKIIHTMCISGNICEAEKLYFQLTKNSFNEDMETLSDILNWANNLMRSDYLGEVEKFCIQIKKRSYYSIYKERLELILKELGDKLLERANSLLKKNSFSEACVLYSSLINGIYLETTKSSAKAESEQVCLELLTKINIAYNNEDFHTARTCYLIIKKASCSQNIKAQANNLFVLNDPIGKINSIIERLKKNDEYDEKNIFDDDNKAYKLFMDKYFHLKEANDKYIKAMYEFNERLGLHYFNKGEHSKAVHRFDCADKWEKIHCENYNEKLPLYSIQNDIRNARGKSKLHELYRLCEKAITLLNQNNPEEAIKWLNEAKKYLNDYDIYYFETMERKHKFHEAMGKYYEIKGNLDLAFENYNKAKSFNALGNICDKRGDLCDKRDQLQYILEKELLDGLDSIRQTFNLQEKFYKSYIEEIRYLFEHVINACEKGEDIIKATYYCKIAIDTFEKMSNKDKEDRCFQQYKSYFESYLKKMQEKYLLQQHQTVPVELKKDYTFETNNDPSTLQPLYSVQVQSVAPGSLSSCGFGTKPIEYSKSKSKNDLSSAYYALNNGEYIRAIFEFKKMLHEEFDDKKDYLSAIRGLVQAYECSFRYKDALNLCEKQLRVLENDSCSDSILAKVFLLNIAGVCCYKLKRYDEAIGYFDEVIKIEPKKANAFYNKGLCYKVKENFNYALESFKNAEDLFTHQIDRNSCNEQIQEISKMQPSLPVPPILKAPVQIPMKELEFQVMEIRAPLRIDFRLTSMEGLLRDAQNDIINGHFKEAEKKFSNLYENFSQHEEFSIQYGLAIVHQKLGNSKKALEYYRVAYDNPKRSNFRFLENFLNDMAICLVHNGNINEALEKLNEIQNDSGIVLYNKGICEKMNRNPEQAMTFFRKAKELFYYQSEKDDCDREILQMKQMQSQNSPSAAPAVPTAAAALVQEQFLLKENKLEVDLIRSLEEKYKKNETETLKACEDIITSQKGLSEHAIIRIFCIIMENTNNKENPSLINIYCDEIIKRCLFMKEPLDSLSWPAFLSAYRVKAHIQARLPYNNFNLADVYLADLLQYQELLSEHRCKYVKNGLQQQRKFIYDAYKNRALYAGRGGVYSAAIEFTKKAIDYCDSAEGKTEMLNYVETLQKRVPMKVSTVSVPVKLSDEAKNLLDSASNYFNAKNYDRAIICCGQARLKSQRFNKHEIGMFSQMIAKCYFEKKELKLAYENCDKAIRHFSYGGNTPSNASEAYLLKARIIMALGKPQIALGYLNMGLLYNPNDAEILKCKADCDQIIQPRAVQTNSAEPALTAQAALVSLQMQSQTLSSVATAASVSLESKAVCNETIQQQQARQAVLVSTAAVPTMIEIPSQEVCAPPTYYPPQSPYYNKKSLEYRERYIRAENSLNNGDFEEAKKQLLDVYNFDSKGYTPYNYLVLNGLANVNKKLNNLNEALIWYRKALELSHLIMVDEITKIYREIQVCNNMAICYMEKGEVDAAVKILEPRANKETLEDIAKGNGNILNVTGVLLYNMAILQEKKGEPKKALEYYKKAKKSFKEADCKWIDCGQEISRIEQIQSQTVSSVATAASVSLESKAVCNETIQQQQARQAVLVSTATVPTASTNPEGPGLTTYKLQ